MAAMWRHRCVFSFLAWGRVILHNPIQLLHCVYSDTVADKTGYMTRIEHVVAVTVGALFQDVQLRATIDIITIDSLLNPSMKQ